MDGPARYLYIARHAEATRDESELTTTGRLQAELLGQRLRDTSVSVIHHGPLPRAARTARLIGDRLDGIPAQASEIAGDYVPYVPGKDELPPESADFALGILDRFSPEELAQGPPLAAEALDRFTGPPPGDEDRHELVITHNFLAAWLVLNALGAPPWRWLGLNHGNAALTVIRYGRERPPSVLVFNDMRHLPEDLRWTGFPPELRV